MRTLLHSYSNLHPPMYIMEYLGVALRELYFLQLPQSRIIRFVFYDRFLKRKKKTCSCDSPITMGTGGGGFLIRTLLKWSVM